MSLKHTSRVINQSTVGCCISSSICHALESLYERVTGKPIKFNVPWVYANRFLTSKDEELSQLNFIKNVGVLKEEDFIAIDTYEKIKSIYDSKKNELTKKVVYKLPNYYDVYSDLEIKDALDNGFPVILGIFVYDNFYKVSETNYVLHMPENTIHGYAHETCLLDYDDKKLSYRALNSYGDKWGDKGYYWLSYDYPKGRCFVLTDKKVIKFYKVQFGAWLANKSGLSKAEAFSYRMNCEGIESRVEKNGLYYKVVVGKFIGKARATQMSNELKARGINNFVVNF